MTRTIPAFTWAVFSCDGPLPTALQDVNTKIFSEWLPALKEYEFAAGYCVEMYDAADKYPRGVQDENIIQKFDSNSEEIIPANYPFIRKM